jgi:hypothetical protein
MVQCRMKDDIKTYLSGIGVDWEEVDDLSAVRMQGRMLQALLLLAFGCTTLDIMFSQLLVHTSASTLSQQLSSGL